MQLNGSRQLKILLCNVDEDNGSEFAQNLRRDILKYSFFRIRIYALQFRRRRVFQQN